MARHTGIIGSFLGAFTAGASADGAAGIEAVGALIHRPAVVHPITSGSSFPPPPLRATPERAPGEAAPPPWASRQLLARYAILFGTYEQSGLAGQMTFAGWVMASGVTDPFTAARVQSINVWFHR